MVSLKRQSGITLLGWLFLLVPLALVGYSALRLVPVYLNYMRVAKSLEQVASEASPEDTPQTIKWSLEKQFDIESIMFPDWRDVDIRRNGRGWALEAKFEDPIPLFANLSLVVDFDKVAETGG